MQHRGVKRMAGLSKMTGDVSKRFDGDAEVWQRGADAAAIIGGIAVGSVLNPCKTFGTQMIAQGVTPAREQGPGEGDAILRPGLAHRGQTIDPCPARQTHQKRLCLIVLRVAEGNDGNGLCRGPFRHQRIARAAGLIMEVASAVCARPMQRVMGHIPRAAELRDAVGFRGRLGPQSMVHGDGRDLWAV